MWLLWSLGGGLGREGWGSQWHRKSVFVMLKCVGVFTWAELQRKNERTSLQTIAELNERIKESLPLMKHIDIYTLSWVGILENSPWHQTCSLWEKNVTLGFIKIRSFCSVKGTKRMKVSHTQIGRKYFQSLMWPRELYPGYLKHSQSSTISKQTDFKDRQNIWIDPSLSEKMLSVIGQQEDNK